MPNVIITMNATTAAMAAMMSEPAMNHAAPPMMPAPTVDPIALPKMRRRMPPITGTTTKRRMKIMSSEMPPAGAAAVARPARRAAVRPC